MSTVIWGPAPPLTDTGNDITKIPYSPLEELGRFLAQICIMVYGIRFDVSAIGEVYSKIEEGVLEIKKKNHDNDFERLHEAQENLVKYIYEIVSYAKENSLTSVDAAAVKAVQFCPVYPFDNF